MKSIYILAFMFSFLAADEYKYLPDTYMGDTTIFKNFPAQVYKGEMAKIEKKSADDVDVRINFAGKYYLNGFTCMDEERIACSSLELVDVTNAKEYKLDEQIIDYNDLAAQHIELAAYKSYTLMIVQYFVKADSRLFDYKTVYYDFKDGKFNALKSAYALPKDVVEFLAQAAECESFDGESFGDEDEEIYKQQVAEYEKLYSETVKAFKTLSEKYKNKKDIMTIMQKYEYML